jgi:hypothetical protein
MALCEYEERRNARLVCQREELQRLLENSGFSDLTWNSNFLRQNSKGNGADGSTAKAERPRTQRIEVEVQDRSPRYLSTQRKYIQH